MNLYENVEAKMSRQVDIKALVSHIVRGDGIDRCRICMGDTSEGQVYLGDTVMMDGDRPVTLSELLETITGVEVQLGEELPPGLCQECSEPLLSAAAFRTFCQQAVEHWRTTIQLLETLPSRSKNESLFAVINEGDISVYHIKPEEVTSNNEDEPEDLVDFPIKSQRVASVVKRCQCPDCGKNFAYAKDLHKHLIESTDYKRACFICAEIMTRDELVLHLKSDHSQQIFDCKKCPALLHSMMKYKSHMSKAHSSGVYTCGDCGRTFPSSHAFRGHSTLHITQTCPICDKLLRNRKCYTYHVKQCGNLDNPENVHQTKNKIMIEVENINENKKVKVGVRGSANQECICDYCNKKFAGKRFLCAHIQIVHMKNTHRPCPFCGKSFAAAHMTEHMKKHERQPTFTCEHCGMILKTRLGYIQHVRLHTGEKPYQCMFCDEKFSASSRRSEHIRKVHKQADIVLKHACSFCPAKFRLPYKLRQHLANAHAENKLSLDYKCPKCHIKFGTVRGLLHHTKNHETFRLRSLENQNP